MRSVVRRQSDAMNHPSKEWIMSMKYLRSGLFLVSGLGLCVSFASASSFTQDFSGTIRQFGNYDGIGLGAPFDGSQTGQGFSGNFAVSDFQSSGPGGHLGPFSTFQGSGPSVLTIQFPTQSFIVNGDGFTGIDFSADSLHNAYSFTLNADIQPDGGSGPNYYLEIEATADYQFFASENPDALPLTLNGNLAGVDIYGEFSISGVAGRSSGANLLYSNLTPGATVPEPASGALTALCLITVLGASYRRMPCEPRQGPWSVKA